jgi:hypothetical protein
MLCRISAAVLLLGGLAMLFTPDEVLRILAPGFPAGAGWIGQLVGAAWLGVAALNWLLRNAVMGGLANRPVVIANLVLYFVSALSLLRTGDTSLVSLGIVPASALAVAYAVLLFAGPAGPAPRRDFR